MIIVVCVAAAADTGAQTHAWRQCLADDPRAVIEGCTSIIFLDPDNDGAFVNRGIAYRRVGELERAIGDYTEAIRLNPLAADAFNNRGNAYQAHKLDYERAIRDYDEAVRLNPRYAQAYNNRGVAFLERGDSLSARADFDRAIRHDSSYANAFRNRGLAYTDQELFDLAIEDYDEAFRLDPAVAHGVEYALALYGRGLARRRRGDANGAVDVEEAKRLLPDVAELMTAEGVR